MGLFSSFKKVADPIGTLDPTGAIGGIVGNITGENQAAAAREAAQIQANAATAQAEAMRESTAMTVEEQRLAREQAREDLMPFTEFGAGFIDQATQAALGAQGLFQDPTSIMENPMFAAIQEDTRRQNLQNAAVGGRLGTGGTLAGLESSALRTGFDILNSERQAQLQNAQFLSNLVGMGQNAAAGQGSASMNAASNIGQFQTAGQQNISDLMTGAASAEAAGIVGAANASAQGTTNLLNIGATLFGAPTPGTTI